MLCQGRLSLRWGGAMREHLAQLHMTTVPRDFQKAKQSAHRQLHGGLRIRRRKGEGGYVMVVAALSIFLLFGLIGLAIDVGQLRTAQRNLQSAADAAAVAGGAEILFPDLTTAAQAAAAANGFTNGSNGVAVSVSHPPTDGPYTGNTNYVEVVVSQNQPTFFMGALGVTSVPLSATAVASGTSPNCIYALGTSGDSLDLSNSNITSSCGVVGDGNLGSSGRLTASSIGVVGTVHGVSTTPTARTGIPKVADPFASLPVPSFTVPVAPSNCQPTPSGANPTIPPGTYNAMTITSAMGNVTFSGGTYVFCGGLTLQGATVTFGPGTYVMYGGGFSMSNGFNGTVTGSGVLFYNTGSGTASGTCPPTCAYGPVTTYFASSNFLQAPTSGTYAGILYFQDRANPQAASFNANFTFNGCGGGTPYLQGGHYFPDATVNFDFDFGCGAQYTIVVAQNINWLFNFTFNNNYGSLPGSSSPIKNTGTLVE